MGYDQGWWEIIWLTPRPSISFPRVGGDLGLVSHLPSIGPGVEIPRPIQTTKGVPVRRSTKRGLIRSDRHPRPPWSLPGSWPTAPQGKPIATQTLRLSPPPPVHSNQRSFCSWANSHLLNPSYLPKPQHNMPPSPHFAHT